MAAGTLSVTNNSTAVVGVGTTFTAFQAGDFLTLVVGQVPYTVAIASIESDTALTLVLPFDGPTAAGLAWDGVKRDTMSLATMGVTVQAQKALRLMIADENNWRAIFGDAEEITVTLPNGQVMQGMSWGYLSQLMKQIDPSRFLAKASNLSDVADVAEARTNLDLDRFKQSTIDTTILEPSGAYTFFVASSDWGYYNSSTHERAALPVQSGGTGGTTPDSACHNLRALNYTYPPTIGYSSPELYTGIGFYADDTSPWPGGNGSPYPYAEIMTVAEGGGGPGSVGNWSQIAFSTITQQAPRYRQRFSNPAQITEWRDFLVRDLNTTVDSNGFIKIASPIVKIKGDGSAELNDESEGCTVTRVEKGVYLISGCLGLNSDASWGGIDGGFEIPVDINKQPLIWIDYKVLSDGAIELRTYHRTYQDSPVFARNIIEGINDGDPIDIPPGTYVSVRVEMPSSDTQATVHP